MLDLKNYLIKNYEKINLNNEIDKTILINNYNEIYKILNEIEIFKKENNILNMKYKIYYNKNNKKEIILIMKKRNYNLYKKYINEIENYLNENYIIEMIINEINNNKIIHIYIKD